jgi:hypothetical protein
MISMSLFCYRGGEKNSGWEAVVAGGVADTPMSMEDIAAMVEARAPKPGRPKTYKKRVAA